jgi:glutathione S-transferase
MKLYYSPGVCSLSPHIVAREAGIDLHLVKVNIETHRTEDGRDYFAINPRGQVPLLELDDGTKVREGAAIVQYLADQSPHAQLAPPSGTMDRVRLQEWLSFIATEFHKQFYWLFHAAPEETRQAQRTKIQRVLSELDSHLEANQHLLGRAFTAADAYCFVILRWCAHVKIDLAPFAALRRYIDRIASRPHVREALACEGLTGR